MVSCDLTRSNSICQAGYFIFVPRCAGHHRASQFRFPPRQPQVHAPSRMSFRHIGRTIYRFCCKDPVDRWGIHPLGAACARAYLGCNPTELRMQSCKTGLARCARMQVSFLAGLGMDGGSRRVVYSDGSTGGGGAGGGGARARAHTRIHARIPGCSV